MAVPFKSKDTPTENTEFGHPDMAIVLTLLSYYQYGLSEKQLMQIFELIQKLPNCEELYFNWTHAHGAINLMDDDFKNQLFEECKFSMSCIHFYLNHFVFPKELKQFPHLLVSTGWDLNKSSGFSGTNDTELLLPNIAQNNLESLKYTNAQVLRNILENDKYFTESNGDNIIKRANLENSQLLIDCGALFKISNYDVALKWLKSRGPRYIDACLYFDEDRLMVVDWIFKPQEYENSAYKGNLDRCLIYLDDYHTRGVDLQLPLKFKGAVTISHDLCKDKFVQSCMRMRMLGSTHELLFIASERADIKIREFESASRVHAILDFVMENTVKTIQSNFMNWAQAGLYHYYKEIAYEMLLEKKNLKLYGEMCLVPEITNLLSYKPSREKQLVTDIVMSMYNTYLNKLQPYQMEDKYIEKCKSILAQVSKYVPDLRHYRQLFNDEQQRELENEVEQETQKYRPKAAKPLVERIDNKVGAFIRNGTTTGFLPFYNGLKKVFTGTTKLFMTSNYQSTVEKSGLDYLRVPLWLIQNKGNVLLVSPFEANHYISELRCGGNASLSMFRPKQSIRIDILLNDPMLSIGHFNEIDITTLMHLFLYSGSLYFENELQQEAYLKVIGHIARPRSDVEELAYGEGLIKDGFLLKECHSRFTMESLFDCRQVDYIKELINVRNRQYNDESHVAKLLLGNKTTVFERQ